LTFGPTSTIVPDISWPITTGSAMPVCSFFLPIAGEKIGAPRYSWISLPQIPQYAIFSRTSSGPHGLACQLQCTWRIKSAYNGCTASNRKLPLACRRSDLTVSVLDMIARSRLGKTISRFRQQQRNHTSLDFSKNLTGSVVIPDSQ